MLARDRLVTNSWQIVKISTSRNEHEFTKIRLKHKIIQDDAMTAAINFRKGTPYYEIILHVAKTWNFTEGDNKVSFYLQVWSHWDD